MFGMNRCGGMWAGGRHGRMRFGGGGGWSGGRGGGGDMLRFGRMLAQGDLRLLALSLIAEQPRHGYEIIKVLEEKTGGWYSPSPGIVYPTLTYLEEAGYVTAQVEGAKKLYTITDEGRAYLDQNRDFVDAVLDRLSALSERVAQWRKWSGRERDHEEAPGPSLPRLVRAALDDLREVAAERLGNDPQSETRIVEALMRATAELRRT